MLFPNHPRFAELRAAMGYMPGAHALGYAPGARSLGYMPGAHALGVVSDSEMQIALDAGLDPNTLRALSSVGATDADIEELMLGDTDVPTLMAKYAGLVTTEGTTVLHDASQTAIQHNGAIPGQVPAGSILFYSASWPGVDGLPQDVIQKLAETLPANQLSVANSTITGHGLLGESAIQLSILDGIGHAHLSDVQSVIEHYMGQFVGNGNLTSSNLTITSLGTGTPTTPNTPAISFTQWLQSNALWIGGGLALLFLGPPLIKKL